MPVDVITRKKWGARYQDGFYDRPLPFSEFWLHHSVTIAPDLVAPFDDDDAAIRTLENIGEQRFSGGISYNQPVTPVGRVYEGVSKDRVGAHTINHNYVGFAFVLVGNYENDPPTAIQEELIARRMVELHREGSASRHTLNGGHRDVYGTSCPGGAAYARIPAINARANQLWALGYPKNDVPLIGQEEDPLMGLTIKLTDTQRDAIYGNHTDSPDTWDAEKALGYIAGQAALSRRYSVRAAEDAAVSRALAEESARKGDSLTDDEITRIAEATSKRTADELSDDFEVTGDVKLAPKAKPVTEVQP